MPEPLWNNLASSEFGVNIVDASSGFQTAQDLLEAKRRTTWITAPCLPQWICIFIGNIRDRCKFVSLCHFQSIHYLFS